MAVGRSWAIAIAGSMVLWACRGDDDATPDDSSSTTTATGTTTGTGSTSGGTTSGASTTSGADTTTTGGDALPPVPMLVSPADGATDVPVGTELCWEPVVDPDGDAVRYRVYVDDDELVAGKPGDPPGFDGPCTSMLLFETETSYEWQVLAFEVDDPTRASDKSEAWSFTTIADPLVHTVFEDSFDDDLGWEISGDATQGAWTRSNPVPTSWFAETAQPNDCAGGQSCYFTGQNPDAIVDDEDVAGGATVLLSPEFDLSGAAAATVELSRFYFQSIDDPATLLRVELLVPDDAQPDGYAATVLEEIDDDASASGANLWHAREYAVCSGPYVAGSRLRITASDEGSGIVEAAIDSVAVRTHESADLCGTGTGAKCDPTLGDAACSDASSCCPQGMVQRGVYRCSSAVAGLDYDDPPPDPLDPGNGAIGCDAPDLILEPSVLAPFTVDIMVEPDSCLLLEGCVDAPGVRRLLLFTTMTPNIGSRDLALGVPANEPDLFHYSDCHDHYHFDHYAGYELRDDNGVVTTGHKQSFCLEDSVAWAWPGEPAQFDCASQGIGRGFADLYDAALPCQWVDVTDVPPGDYTLHIELNVTPADAAEPVLVERDYENNAVDAPVTLD